MRTARFLLAFGTVSVMALVAGCSDGGGGNNGTQPKSCDELTPAANQEFCEPLAATCTEPPAGSKISVCGVSLREPPGALTRSADVDEFAGSGPPKTECFAPSSYPPAPGASSTAKITGTAKIFSNGDKSEDLTIEIYTVKRTGGADDGMPDQLIGSPVVTASDCTALPDTVHTTLDDGTERYECPYEYDGVPTETELLVKTSGDPTWAELYEYNVYIPNDEVSGGVWKHNVRALAAGDYTVIPQAAIGAPITPGNGAIAGEVHDCGDVRLSMAIVDIDKPKKILTYFTPNEDKPLPDLSAKGTSRLGLYAALDVKPGPVKVAATGLVDGKPVTLGFFAAQIFPDAVTAVTFRGMRPFQIPAK